MLQMRQGFPHQDINVIQVHDSVGIENVPQKSIPLDLNRYIFRILFHQNNHGGNRIHRRVSRRVVLDVPAHPLHEGFPLDVARSAVLARRRRRQTNQPPQRVLLHVPRPARTVQRAHQARDEFPVATLQQAPGVPIGRRDAREETASVLLDAFLVGVAFHRGGDFLYLGVRYEVGGVALVERDDRPEDAEGFDLDDDVGRVGGHDHHD
mmetsp:Transcript_11663/g.22076  ORF Transcript_11663/g.22076 Transcript_11663/m.22076 type:complete len:208 (-) Transcript_11663:1856-2479(-)